MLQLIPLIAMLGVIAFWLWMFSDMLNNPMLPPCFITWSDGENPKSDWTVCFILLNIFAAIFYYANVVRNRSN